eukprot:13971460-Alexandrium_andersonii.AAC.1
MRAATVASCVLLDSPGTSFGPLQPPSFRALSNAHLRSHGGCPCPGLPVSPLDGRSLCPLHPRHQLGR